MSNASIFSERTGRTLGELMGRAKETRGSGQLYEVAEASLWDMGKHPDWSSRKLAQMTGVARTTIDGVRASIGQFCPIENGQRRATEARVDGADRITVLDGDGRALEVLLDQPVLLVRSDALDQAATGGGVIPVHVRSLPLRRDASSWRVVG